MTCAVCQKTFDAGGYLVYDASSQTRICSPSCLVEYAWQQKTAQEKLSKSKQTS